MLTQRQIDIFKAIVDEFTRTAEPVGSKTLMSLLDFHCSSATIRNEMAVLEDVGLLEKTHTSSGRIPSRKGYRFYVEHLMEKELDNEVKHSLQQVFNERHHSMDEIVRKSCDILSQMTHLTSVVLGLKASIRRCSTYSWCRSPAAARSRSSSRTTDIRRTRRFTSIRR